jgi:hypothetical protein
MTSKRNLKKLKKNQTFKKGINKSFSNKKKMDLKKMDLKKMDLKKMDLKKMDLKKMDLKKMDLKKRNLSLKKRISGMQFLNVGSTNTTIRNNNNTTNSSIKWTGNYNGKLANIHVDVNDNGRKENMDIKLTNDDISQLLGYPSIEKQVDARLFDDFLGNQKPIYVRM